MVITVEQLGIRGSSISVSPLIQIIARYLRMQDIYRNFCWLIAVNDHGAENGLFHRPWCIKRVPFCILHNWTSIFKNGFCLAGSTVTSQSETIIRHLTIQTWILTWIYPLNHGYNCQVICGVIIIFWICRVRGLVFHRSGFHKPMPSQHWETMDNENIPIRL